jgi:hypothetical protein
MNTPFRLTLIFSIVSIIFTELFLRALGVHRLPTYEASPKFEYRTAPNQTACIFGKRWSTNKVGLRGELPRNQDKKIVWYAGDSVINGGIHTSDDSLATTKWDKNQEQSLGYSVATINISQGSWGPENSFCFALEYGDELGFPDVVVLALSSHDWSDNMTFCYSGQTRDMPTFNLCGIHALFNKYFGPENDCAKHAITSIENPGLKKWVNWAMANDSKLVAYIHPTVAELQSGQLNHLGDSLVGLLKKKEIPMLDGLRFLSEENYRDNIHLNDSGQSNLANALTDFIKLTE